MRDAARGRARGFAFVELGLTEEAQKAATDFKSVPDGRRALTVNEGVPSRSSPAVRRVRGNGRRRPVSTYAEEPRW